MDGQPLRVGIAAQRRGVNTPQACKWMDNPCV